MFRIQVVLKTKRTVDDLQAISTGTGLRAPAGEAPSVSRHFAHKDGTVVSHTHRPLLSPCRHSWYSLLLGAESTPGPWRGRKDKDDTIGNRNRDLSTCSAVSQSTALLRTFIS